MKLMPQLVLASASVLALAAPAYAQNASPNETGQTAVNNGEDIIVTARRRDESKQDVPLVVNAVTGQDLQKLNIRDFKDISQVVPGLTLVPNPNGIGAQSQVRGVNHDVNTTGDNGTIQYYLDDAPVGSDVIFQTMFDVGQIEVLRGPQGTLRGRATPSGSITITSHQPDLERPGAYIDGTVASHDAYNMNFGVGTPIIADKLAVRVAGVYDTNRGNQVTSINDPADRPFSKTQALRATVRFEPVDWFKAGFSFLTIHHDAASFPQAISFSQVDPTVPTGGPNYGTLTAADRKSVAFAPNTFTQDFKRYSWNAQLSGYGQKLIYVGSHATSHYASRGNSDPSGIFPTLRPAQVTDTSNVGWSHEIRLQNDERVAGMLDYVVGFFQQTGQPVTHLTSTTLLQPCNADVTAPPVCSPSFLGGLGTTATPIDLPLVETKERSYFANATLHFFDDKAELSGGFRHIKYTDPGQNLYINCANPTFAGCTPASAATPNNFSKTIYNFTAKYRFNDNLMLYASTGTSVRPGAHAIGDFSAAPFSPNEQRHTVTSPETSTSYEVGVKSDWLDKTLTVNLTYYHQNFKNYAYRAPGAGVFFLNYQDGVTPSVGSFNFISAVPVKIDGIEAEVDYRPSRHFYLNTSFNYSKSKIGTAELACNLPGIGAVPTVASLQAAFATAGYPAEHLGVCTGGGSSANFSPNFSATMQGEYSLPVSNRVEGFVRGLLSFRGSTPADPSNPYDDIGSYALVNAYVGVRDPDGGWSLTFYAKNIGNLVRYSDVNGLNASPSTIAATNIFLSGTTTPPYRVPVGSTSTLYTGNYGGVNVIAPREFGLNLRVAIGSR